MYLAVNIEAVCVYVNKHVDFFPCLICVQERKNWMLQHNRAFQLLRALVYSCENLRLVIAKANNISLDL